MARAHLGDRSAPGATFRLLRSLIERHQSSGLSRPVNMRDVLQSMSRLTGLPADVLDDNTRLKLDTIRESFSKRVLGQTEAVECLVERIALIKAGLTDPNRPLGVFLFAGPTGTGKTEIAKSLASYLFGSDKRLIRLDMTEFSGEDCARQLIATDTGAPGSQSLLTQIRQQPFSVILLDEFEKAHPAVWDLFLQVFDDGRLTDAQGNTADFRHAIIILTSNLGATIGSGSSIGFTLDKASFSLSAVRKAVEETFRREFVNRLDRIVVFRPLDRSLMREILQKELAEAMDRRGLRNRDWVVEWEESAVEFLLDRGFTADLGARPLKRAVERHVLAPLAMTIVERQFPEGDQFLFFRSNGDRIQAEFVDPDGPDRNDQTDSPLLEPELDKEITLRSIVLTPHGRHEELRVVRNHYEELAARFSSETWQDRKEKALAQTNSLAFWDSPNRFQVLGEIEFMDRAESAMKTAEFLLHRLDNKRTANGPRTESYSTPLLRRLAQQLYLVDTGCRSFDRDEANDAFVLIDSGKPNKLDPLEADKLFHAIVTMYAEWAKKRGMRSKELGGSKLHTSRRLFAVSGFGAYSILAGETGLHVWEVPTKGRDFTRFQVHVRIAPQPPTPALNELSEIQQAERLFAHEGNDNLEIIRRYREAPSPLVRDSRGGWRTGNLDRVLAGDFDLFD